jgi:hypothetical protein
MLIKVANDNILILRNNNQWLIRYPNFHGNSIVRAADVSFLVFK